MYCKLFNIDSGDTLGFKSMPPYLKLEEQKIWPRQQEEVALHLWENEVLVSAVDSFHLLSSRSRYTWEISLISSDDVGLYKGNAQTWTAVLWKFWMSSDGL